MRYLTIAIAMIIIAMTLSNSAIAGWSTNAYLEAGNNALAEREAKATLKSESANNEVVKEIKFKRTLKLVYDDNNVARPEIVLEVVNDEMSTAEWLAWNSGYIALALTMLLIAGVIVAYSFGKANGHF